MHVTINNTQTAWCALNKTIKSAITQYIHVYYNSTTDICSITTIIQTPDTSAVFGLL